MFLLLLTLATVAVQSLPEAEYQIFNFQSWTVDGEGAKEEPDTTGSDATGGDTTEPGTSIIKLHHHSHSQDGDSLLTTLAASASDISIENVTSVHKSRRHKFTCPENEHPSNIGSYEVPTQRDLVLLTRKTLHRMFGSYHQKAMLFLEDISKATRATKEVERKCLGNRLTYRQCVKHVSGKCETITKSLTSALELQRQDVMAFGQKTICKLQDMKADPVKLIKIMASEEASLEFALPGFLRLLDACSSYCASPTDDAFKAKKPSRHLTDTDIVIRHFLTKKTYTRLVPTTDKPKVVFKKKDAVIAIQHKAKIK